jgi:Fe-S-cluster containining protein
VEVEINGPCPQLSRRGSCRIHDSPDLPVTCREFPFDQAACRAMREVRTNRGLDNRRSQTRWIQEVAKRLGFIH